MDCVSFPQCTICDSHKDEDQTWFVVTESRWRDTLNIWKWNKSIADEVAAYSLCSRRHVRELIVHWMATGCLHYPFAKAYSASPSFRPKSDLSRKGQAGQGLDRYWLGEITVDREGIARALRGNALSLNVILDELMIVLENQAVDDPEAELEDQYRYLGV